MALFMKSCGWWFNLLGLCSCEGRMLGSDVPLGALRRFEGHRAIGALMKHLTVSCLNVGLDRIQTSEHNLTTGAPGIKEVELLFISLQEISQGNCLQSYKTLIGNWKPGTCSRCAWQSAGRILPDGFETWPGGQCHHTLGTHGVRGAYGSADGPTHCTS